MGLLARRPLDSGARHLRVANRIRRAGRLARGPAREGVPTRRDRQRTDRRTKPPGEPNRPDMRRTVAGRLSAVSDWAKWRGSYDVADYDGRWQRMQEAGQNPHGEADLVASLLPRNVLDAGCGTGRVAIELYGRGIDVVGVDLDVDMLAVARAKAPDLAWVHADLSRLELLGRFDVVVMAGNVIHFVEPERRADAVASCARHLTSGGRVVAGWQLTKGPTLADYDRWCDEVGLVLENRYATWERSPYVDAGDYAVSVHRARLGTAN